ncbi:MAG: 2-vinyl bacteriochlorophyllide hydratase [Pseudomonadota bacterium]
MPTRQTKPLYNEIERQRRDQSPWTRVQAVLAPIQFVVFVVSVALVLHYMATGEGLLPAHGSIVIKTLILYTIMITGAIWEKDVFGQYLFAPAFFWEDVVSMAVIGFHTAYLVMLLFGVGSPITQLIVALIGYLIYVVNAGQFVWKLRAARLGAAQLREAPA